MAHHDAPSPAPRLAAANPTTSRTNLTRMACWREWRRMCSIDLSSRRTQEVLRIFAAHQFTTWTTRYIARTNAGTVASIGLSGRQAWHLFESHVTVTQTRAGKAYKNWLFARGRGDARCTLNAIEGGASLIMRDVARNHLLSEFSPAATVSMTMPVHAGDGTPVTLGDLLPGAADPLQAIAARELADLARRHAQSLFGAMTRRERIALLAKQARISLAHPAVLTAAGCGRSALHEAYTHAARRVHRRITEETHSHSDAHSVFELAAHCLRALSELLSTWGATTGACTELLEMTRELAAL